MLNIYIEYTGNPTLTDVNGKIHGINAKDCQSNGDFVDLIKIPQVSIGPNLGAPVKLPSLHP
jgi:hypothetical protein